MPRPAISRATSPSHAGPSNHQCPKSSESYGEQTTALPSLSTSATVPATRSTKCRACARTWAIARSGSYTCFDARSRDASVMRQNRNPPGKCFL
jgi:hypothetical protein